MSSDQIIHAPSSLPRNKGQLAHAAGSDLKINTHNDRYSRDVRYTPLVNFTATLFCIVGNSVEQNIPTSWGNPEARRAAAFRVGKLFKKSRGNLIAPLEKARRELEGCLRASKRPQT